MTDKAEKKYVKRINIGLSGPVYDYFQNLAEVSGQALSAVVVMALMEYLEQKDAMTAIQEMIKIEQQKQLQKCRGYYLTK